MTLATIPYRPTNGSPEDVSQIIADFDSMLSVMNGGIGADNFSGGQILAPSKLTNEGTPGVGQSLVWDGAKYIPGAPGYIAVLYYAPSSNIVLTTSSTTFVDMDAVNLQLSPFVAPASGKVFITSHFYMHLGVHLAMQWKDIAGAGTLVGLPSGVSAGSAPNYIPQTMHHYISGLTPGTSYTLRLQWKTLQTSQTCGVTIGNADTTGDGMPFSINVRPIQ
jgi:hypothetical protein